MLSDPHLDAGDRTPDGVVPDLLSPGRRLRQRCPVSLDE